MPARSKPTADADPPVRRRAPRQAGAARKQVAVPAAFWRELVELAARLGTTPNDVLVRLAMRGYAEVERAERLRRIGDERWAAFLRRSPTEDHAAKPPGEEDLVAASRDFAAD